ncbi:MAG TPA: iron-containing redox enzyme family protein, partial [Acidimicrobiales bacterium]
MLLPSPAGPFSDHVLATLRRPPGTARLRWVPPSGPDDEQLALFLLQHLSYRRFDGVDPAWEDDPSFLVLRERLEHSMELRLRARLDVPACDAAEVPDALVELLDGAGGPSLSGWVAERATLDHLREFLVHRSAYQLHEADPHSFAIPRIAAGTAKTALLELQMDEYGGHEPTEAHAVLFAETMRATGLDPRPGTGLSRLPAVTLATNTLLNRLGRSRRLVGALVGHLAVFEMTSVEPMSRYAAACRRLLPGPTGTRAARFFDVHVAADGFHAKLAIERLVQGFVDQHPDDAREVLFGAAALLHVEEAFSRHLVEAWDAGTSSLRTPLPGSALRPAPAHAPLPIA